MKIGIISDTHNLLRPEAIAALQGSAHILHAGDIGDISILRTLEKIAPVTAIRGNTDNHGPTSKLPHTEPVELAGHLFYLVHSIDDLDLNPQAAKISAVIHGHSHTPSIRTHKGVLYLNPGAAGPRRFALPISIAHIQINGPTLTPTLQTLIAD